MIATVDVGLKNLAICIMNCTNKNDFKSYCLPLWEVYNLLDEEKQTCCNLIKSGNVCGKNAMYKYTENVIENTLIENAKDNLNQDTNTTSKIIYTCKTHFPKTKSNLLPRQVELVFPY